MPYQIVSKSEYLRHPELNLLFRKEYVRFFVFLHIPFYIILFFTRDFPDFLGTMDATIVVLAILYSLLIKPLIKNGTIRAYYRKHYRTKTTGSFLSIVYTAIWFGTLFRSTLLVGNFLIQYFTFEERDVPLLVAGMKMNYLNGNGALVGAVFFFLFIYVLYYKNRYISIQDFSIRVMRYVKEHGLNVQVAMEKVLYEQQDRLEKIKVQQVTHLLNNKKVAPTQIVKNEEKEESVIDGFVSSQKEDLPSEVEVKQNKPTSLEIIVPMRRQARR
ncbi:hypothetical protein SMD22_01885 (plasmid) [Brevibacillus halotolerans]|nr:hypothetical protein SMD22_01885 [Brevibacillus halotolerans]